ncbi:hypothetical protein [Thermogemmatispora tikiterensis]|nr:hypothetical protein [Thermogemmatispora tikiterensis]
MKRYALQFSLDYWYQGEADQRQLAALILVLKTICGQYCSCWMQSSRAS